MKTLIIGLDAFDPSIFERLSEQGRLPNLTRYVEAQGYSRFQVADPPQSEVSWTSIATGLNPGHHGLFDFVHRDPANYGLSVSLLPTRRKLGATQFVPPHTARTIFDHAAQEGYPSTALWWPATFPARPESPVRTLPGLGTPDIRGRWGVGSLFSTEPELRDAAGKIPVEHLSQAGRNRYRGWLKGPAKGGRSGTEEATVEFQLDMENDERGRLTVNKERIELVRGQWSPIFEVTFKMGWFVKVRALTRAILTQTGPEVRLYFLPLQLHPLHSPWRYGTPGAFVKEAWQHAGPFLTLGWPQDTTALEEGYITGEQFLDLCESIVATRERLLLQQIERFEEGLLASVFDTLDRVQHMFWRDRPDIIDDWYVRYDQLMGRVQQKVAHAGGSETRVVVVSDHGFSSFDYHVHLNRWLIDHGYLVPEQEKGKGDFREIVWSRSRAYAVGLNGLYLNLAGREGEGCVASTQRDQLLEELKRKLCDWQGPDGRSVITLVQRQEEAFEGSLAPYGPDLVLGFTPGYRASSATGLGGWKAVPIEENRDRWSGDHCFNSQAVPGVLFSNRALTSFPNPSYRDFPTIAIDAQPDSSDGAPPSYDPEDEEIVEERLKSLGYF